jgi:hypothetical protein
MEIRSLYDPHTEAGACFPELGGRPSIVGRHLSADREKCIGRARGGSSHEPTAPISHVLKGERRTLFLRGGRCHAERAGRRTEYFVAGTDFPLFHFLRRSLSNFMGASGLGFGSPSKTVAAVDWSLRWGDTPLYANDFSSSEVLQRDRAPGLANSGESGSEGARRFCLTIYPPECSKSAWRHNQHVDAAVLQESRDRGKRAQCLTRSAERENLSIAWKQSATGAASNWHQGQRRGPAKCRRTTAKHQRPSLIQAIEFGVRFLNRPPIQVFCAWISRCPIPTVAAGDCLPHDALSDL